MMSVGSLIIETCFTVMKNMYCVTIYLANSMNLIQMADTMPTPSGFAL